MMFKLLKSEMVKTNDDTILCNYMIDTDLPLKNKLIKCTIVTDRIFFSTNERYCVQLNARYEGEETDFITLGDKKEYEIDRVPIITHKLLSQFEVFIKKLYTFTSVEETQ